MFRSLALIFNSYCEGTATEFDVKENYVVAFSRFKEQPQGRLQCALRRQWHVGEPGKV